MSDARPESSGHLLVVSDARLESSREMSTIMSSREGAHGDALPASVWAKL